MNFNFLGAPLSMIPSEQNSLLDSFSMAQSIFLSQNWSRKFGQGAKWRFCSPAA